MKLDRITFTGADDSVNPYELVAISKSWPIVEWGILFSASQQGSPRYPSEGWLDRFGDAMVQNPNIRLSAHLCGRWVRDFVLDGQFTWFEKYPHLGRIFQRVQINFHGQFHKACDAFPGLLTTMKSTEFILQCDGVNDHSVRDLAEKGLCMPLFDTSGGAGVVPDDGWPTRWPGIYCGYAGGLGPSTIDRELPKIAEASPGQAFWIDMERRVRSEDDRTFEISKIGEVLMKAAAYL